MQYISPSSYSHPLNFLFNSRATIKRKIIIALKLAYYNFILSYILSKHLPTDLKTVCLTGVIIKKSPRFITLLDCSGIVEVSKKAGVEIEGICFLKCRVYNKNFLYLIEARRATFYEEIYRWIEMCELDRIKR